MLVALVANLPVVLAYPGSRPEASAEGSGGGGSSFGNSVSADGRVIAFASANASLVEGDSNGVADIFVRDITQDTFELTSVSVLGGSANGESFSASISGDGRYVAFVSSATNLAPPDVTPLPAIYLRDRVQQTTIWLAPAANTLTRPTISFDGGVVAFESLSGRIQIWQRATPIPEFVSHAPAATEGFHLSPALSPDGRYIAYLFMWTRSPTVSGAEGTNDCGGNSDDDCWIVLLYDLWTKESERVAVSNTGFGGGIPSTQAVSWGARRIVFSSEERLVPGLTSTLAQLYVYDRRSRRFELVARTPAGDAVTGYSFDPSISYDGRRVAFWSRSRELIDDDVETCPGDFGPITCPDVFVRDLRHVRYIRVSEAADGTGGNGFSFWPALSASGRVVTFTSGASNLTPEDDNDTGDVFRKVLHSGSIKCVSCK